MKKVPFIKRFIALALCAGMAVGGNVSALATETAAAQTSEDKIYTYEDSEILVEATAASGVLPSDAELEVTPITEGAAYEEVEAQLASDASEKDYEVAGFLAYDIRFVDKKGNEIEPEGSVAVSMEYKSAAIPEGMDNAEETCVSVMHLEESEDAVEVKDLTADSTVSTTEENAVDSVEFVTESFSTFSLVWRNSDINIPIYYMDESGNEISGTQTYALEFDSESSAIVFSEIAEKIDGYSYQKAVVGYNKFGDTEAEYMCATLEVDKTSGVERKILTFYNGENEVVTTIEDHNYGMPLYFVYKKTDSVSGKAENQIDTLDTRGVIDINVFDYKANVPGNTNEGIGTLGNYWEGYGINTNHYLKFMNNAGNGSPNQNRYYGATAVQGIVANRLGSDGYPQLASWGNGESLNYLFDENDIANAKKCFPDASYLFVKDEEGYYSYDSDSNFATLAGCTVENNFTVYNTAKGGFFPLTSYAKIQNCNDRNLGDDLGSDETNHYFGMTVETDFVQPQNGKINDKDMVFEFSGDDDVWVFIDDVLVLDIGGIHGKVSGSINFATGQVYVNSVGEANSEYTTTIKDMFTAANVSTEDFIGNTFDNFSTHTMKFYYLERGNQESNCKLKFNLQTIPKGSLFVSKNATETEEGDASDYEFVIKDANGSAFANAAYTLNTDSAVRYTDANGRFTLKSGQYALFTELSSGNYSVTETGVLNSTYSLKQFTTKVSVNGTVQTIYDADYAQERTAAGTVNDAASTRFEFKNILNQITVTGANSELSKVVKYNQDEDDYALTLSFKGPEETVTTTVTDTVETATNAKLDIVIVFDTSGSMANNYNNLNKLNKAKSAANSLIDSISNNANIDSRWKLVTFSNSAVTRTVDNGNSTWCGAQQVKTLVNALGAEDGTNYQAALVTGNNEVNSGAREGAQRVIIFLTDGEPTYHLCDWFGNVSNSGSRYDGGGYYVADGDYYGAIMGARAVNCDSFYSVGIGFETGAIYYNKTASQILSEVTEAVQASNKTMYESNVTDLTKIFSEISQDIQENTYASTTVDTYYSSDVTVTDWLSQYVDIVKGSEFQISVKDQSGNEVGSSEAGRLGESPATYQVDGQTLTAEYDDNNGERKVVLDFPQDYQLSGGYTYSVTFKVTASEKAYEEYATNGYPHTGEEGTDAADNNPATSSGQKGFRSNDKAEVTYTYKAEPVTETYKHPVVQVHNRYHWRLVKTSASASGHELRLAGAKFLLQSADAAFYGISGKDGAVTWYSDDSYAEQLAADIPDGTYELTEIEAPSGYALDTTVWDIIVSKAEGIRIENAAGSYNGAEDLITKQEGADITQTLYFEDEAIYSLPETGGCGILLYTFTGMLMIMGGALYLFLVRRRSYCKK